jgi:septal ring factor EnvC (AmiA/AmiB activator)
MKRTIRYLALICAGLAVASAGAGAGSPTTADSIQAQAKLAAVREQIAALTSRLGNQLKDRNARAARLREADLNITSKRRRLDRLQADQLAAEHRRSDLKAEEARIQNALEAQRGALASQVRAAYMMGEHEQMKLLFSQHDPGGAGRMAAFYGYFARERVAKIDAIRSDEVRLKEFVVEVERSTAVLQALKIDAARELADLHGAREERASALAAVTEQMRSGHHELDQLKREEQAEESLVAELARVLEDFPVAEQQSFAGLRGELPWPVQGKLTSRYHEIRANTVRPGAHWNGVLIDTARGAKVRAPYFGRVVYADWLQGLGLLLIIGHRGNYMTLYGNAEVLYKSVGDWVAPGDVIAALSDAGGAVPQLYFEIRDGRRAVDPKGWLRPAP